MLFSALLLLALLLTIVQGLPSPARLERRYVAGLVAPAGYNYSWSIDQYRLAIATDGAASYLNRSTIAKSGTTTNATIAACTSTCESTFNCTMSHLIQFNNFTEGNLICALYSKTIAKQYATYKYGLWNDTSAQVISSYSFTRNTGPVPKSNGTTTTTTSTFVSTSSKASTTTSSSIASATTPAVVSSSSTSSTLVTSVSSTISPSSARASSNTVTPSVSSSATSTATSTMTTTIVSSSSSSSSTSATASATPAWKWIDVPGTMCSDGSQTGFAINVNANSTELVINYEQGGSCFDYYTCYVQHRAWNIGTPFNGGTFTSQNQASYLDRYLLTGRNIAGNPFATSNYAFIPYCTGDLHAGNATVTYDNGNGTSYVTNHHGYVNGGLMTSAIKAQLPNITHVWVTGSSAGGFGAIMQYQQTQSIFSGIRVDIIADSSETPKSLLVHPTQNMVMPDLTLCPQCNVSNFDSFMPGYAAATPTSRFASFSWSNDTTVPVNQNVNFPDFQVEVQSLFKQLTAMNNAKTYMLQGSNHVLLDKYTTMGSGNVTMAQFLTKMKNDDASWASVS